MPEIEKKIDIDKPYAEIERRSGRAAIVEPSGKLWIVEIEKKGHELQDGEGVHMGMFLQPAMNDFEFREAGEYPFKELIAYIRLAYFQESCLMMVLIAVDPENTKKLRREAAKTAAVLIAKKRGVKDWLVKRLVDVPLPRPAADVDGVPNAELKAFINGLPIRRVRIIKTPPGFAPQEIREQWLNLELPLATDAELAADPPSENGIGNENEGGHYVLREKAIQMLIGNGKQTAVEFWTSLPLGKYLVFKKKYCELVV